MFKVFDKGQTFWKKYNVGEKLKVTMKNSKKLKYSKKPIVGEKSKLKKKIT